ncbi:hypothetical protein DB88DRAFT_480494 [Papiliotrema laurentii]|uniref:Uncharacterized protein n=1 Tax=Papiliotrema laurentii TaxID=5418 RepID=A0AAD9FTP3_PAPLA|nr:hypothetical protein DB88DRAFT_480494 [Papiliotrema laurentii]
MATATAPASRAQHSYGPTYRHHPYAQPGQSASAPRAAPTWHSNKDREAREQVREREHREKREPPSPPRSRRDPSETPPLGLGVAFGGAPGGKWWDEELPAPPSSLTSILDSFRRSGEGDRELLLSILGAKKAEEERLTALIQTRLTILQARLSIHSAAASLSYSPPTPQSDAIGPKDIPAPIMPERTPSLGSSSRASASSTSGPVSPSYMAPPPMPAQLASEKNAIKSSGYFTLPPPQSMLRNRSRSRTPPLDHRHPHHARTLPPVRLEERDSRYMPRGSSSPKSVNSDGRAPGLDMLLDAGMERERRDSNERQ